MRTILLLLTFAACAVPLPAQSALITNITNPAGGGSAYFGIAQGSLMLIDGYGLGAGPLNTASPPLPASEGLAGTTVIVTVNGATMSAPIYYTSPGDVEAILPSLALQSVDDR